VGGDFLLILAFWLGFLAGQRVFVVLAMLGLTGSLVCAEACVHARAVCGDGRGRAVGGTEGGADAEAAGALGFDGAVEDGGVVYGDQGA
jgi:hypothetical protein